MKQSTLGFTMLAIGMALGLAVPPLLAQSDAPPKVQKWEQYCERITGRVTKVNERLKAAGDKGFELVGAFGDDFSLYCYRRPMP
ncbi:MAG: hypothetical protein AAGF92_17700 [Myxococcota bacterium]